MKPTLQWITDQHDGTGKVNSNDYGVNQKFITNFGSKVHLMIADPVVIQDLLVTKNALFDKTGLFARIFKNFFGNSFLFSVGDDIWK